jgi:hypothetical protein
LLDLEFLATGCELYRYPLAYGPEGVTLEGRKTVMDGKREGSAHTLLNVVLTLLQQAGDHLGMASPGTLVLQNLCSPAIPIKPG